MSFLSQLLQRVIALVDRHRAACLVFLSITLFILAYAGVAAWRPPILVPALDAVSAGFQRVFSKPLALGTHLQSPKVSQSRIMELELEASRLRELGRENARLRRMLEYTPLPGWSTIPARIVGLDLDPLKGTAWVNRGSSHGVAEGQPVVAAGGLVGVVAEAGRFQSRLRLLRHPDTPVSVRNTRTRVVGVVEWDPAGMEMGVNLVPRQADVAPEDTLVSSGLGGVFPENLPVGTVKHAATPEGRIIQSITLTPFAEFFKLEEVFILHDIEGPPVHGADSSKRGAP